MLLFRSEEDLDRWLRARGSARGATFTLPALWELATRWYASRLDPDYRGRTPAQAEEIFASVGLTGPFWQAA